MFSFCFATGDLLLRVFFRCIQSSLIVCARLCGSALEDSISLAVSCFPLRNSLVRVDLWNGRTNTSNFINDRDLVEI